MTTAHQIVKTLLGELVFVGNNGRPRGYIGIVDISYGVVRAVWSEDILGSDHSELGRNDYWYRWRYATNRTSPVVLWSTDPSGEPEVKSLLEDWLDRKGFRVAGHTTDFNRWSGY